MPYDGQIKGQKGQCDWNTENEDRTVGDEVRDRQEPDHIRLVDHCKQFRFYAESFIKRDEMIYTLGISL